MSRSVGYSPEARTDIVEIGAYFVERNPAVEERFNQAVWQTARMLADQPGLGERCQFKNPEYMDLCVRTITGFKNYLIFFRSNPSTLTVVRVIHGAGNYAEMFDEK